MTLFGYHASHEQFAPSALRDLVILAEEAGFAAAKTSDHFHPWSERQGQSGFAWAWLGAAMQATALPFGAISAPGAVPRGRGSSGTEPAVRIVWSRCRRALRWRGSRGAATT